MQSLIQSTCCARHVVMLQNGLNSPRRIQAAQNRRWDEVYREIVEDREMLIDAAMEAEERLNAAHPSIKNPVDWREIGPTPFASFCIDRLARVSGSTSPAGMLNRPTSCPFR